MDRHGQGGPVISSLVRFPGAARHRVFCESLVVHGPQPAIYHRPLELEVIGTLWHAGHSSMARGMCSELFDGHPNLQHQGGSEFDTAQAHVANIDIKAPPSESADSGLWEQTTGQLRDIGWSVREECSTAALYVGDPTLDLPMFGPVHFVRVRWPLCGLPGDVDEDAKRAARLVNETRAGERPAGRATGGGRARGTHVERD
ncbi:hypothetical protein EWM64_g141 [Hericium alpestre]|uniref:Uncharacterized protein n=1 Tax=Hericium alpestre TaxID=135208 RepID=A0A4Z0AAS0_9AGAM|nr:hypothetical protein EWM64_g141 [Hericium alpestre]